MHTRTPHSAYPFTYTQKTPESDLFCYNNVHVHVLLKIDRPRRDHISSTHGTYSLSSKKFLLGSSKSSPKKQHAHAAELLLPYLRDRPAGSSGGTRVLDVGAGSGYLTSVFYHLVFGGDAQPQPQQAQPQEGGGGSERERTSAVVVGIEHIPALTALAEKNIRADGLGKAIDERGIVLVTGDGRLGAFHPSLPPFLPSISPFLFWSKTKPGITTYFIFLVLWCCLWVYVCRVRREGPV
jgi:SAM-dependent methyltransferase